jgi:chromosome segregation ATPase
MIDPEFSAVLSLITLLADPAAAKARLQELRAAQDALLEQEISANSVIASHRAERAKLDAEAAAVRKREIAVSQQESRLATDRDEIERWKRDQRASRLVEVAPGLTREIDDTENEPDPITNRFAEPMGTVNRDREPAAVRAAPRHKSRARA